MELGIDLALLFSGGHQSSPCFANSCKSCSLGVPVISSSDFMSLIIDLMELSSLAAGREVPSPIFKKRDVRVGGGPTK